MNLNRIYFVCAGFSDKVREVAFEITHPGKGLAINSSHDLHENLLLSYSKGIKFIKQSQSSDGSFRDFLLEVGTSTTWTTAHASYVMETIPELNDVAAKAASYLYKAGCLDGAWGYNRRVREDNDSSAQALIVLHHHHYDIPKAWIEQIIGSQSKGGGFPTYRSTNKNGIPANGWQAPHADVTAVVIHMLKCFNIFLQERIYAEQWLSSILCDGVIPSYWWPEKAYGIWVQMRTDFIPDIGKKLAVDLLPNCNSIPFLPMLLESMADDTFFEPMQSQGLRQLLNAQNKDGSWSCNPCLRLTSPDEYEHCLKSKGKVYPGERRLFSTVHTVAALRKFLGEYATHAS